jgi:two-component system chemotaxis response regulator CheY
MPTGHAIRRVLLVDDDAVIQMIGGALLKRGGYDVEIARDGTEALQHVERGEPFDLVITDLNMPNRDGLALLDALRARPATSGIPIIMLTGAEDDDRRTSLAGAGALGWLAKPIDARTFLDQLRALLANRG